MHVPAARACQLMLVAVVAFTSPGGASAAGSPPGPIETNGLTSGSGFSAVSPVRVLDTRDGTGGTLGPAGPGGTVVVDLSARVPPTARAVVLNVTGTAPTSATFVTVYPYGVARPLASNLNLVAGETRPNLVTVGIGESRRIALFNNAGSTHLIADLAGFYAPDVPSRFTALSPTRALDTREQFGPVGPGEMIEIDLHEKVPVTATAVTLNLTGTGATAPTYVTAWPSETPRPITSNLNLVPGQTAPNQVTVPLIVNRWVSLYNNLGSVHLIADVAGFYTDEYGALFNPAPVPTRVLDTRTGTGAPARPVGPGQSIDVTLGMGLPGPTTGLVLNVTGTGATSPTYVTAWPYAEGRPLASNLNLVAGQTAPNLTTIGVGPLATVSLYNNAGSVHLIADLAGWFEMPDVPCAGGCVHAWGLNDRGQLGTASTILRSPVPWPVWGLSRATAIAGNWRNGYALRANGTVVGWGDNTTGQLGGAWMGSKVRAPVPVLDLTGITAIAAGEGFAIALRSDGTVWLWGQIAGGGWPVQLRPVRVPGIVDATAIGAGSTSAYAVLGDGSLVAWGSNQHGQLGIGSDQPSAPDPLPVVGLTGVVDVSGGQVGGYAVTSDGTAWAWGLNDRGQFGTGSACVPGSPDCRSNVPLAVPGLTGVTEITGSWWRVFAVLGDGTARAWGLNERGALGDGVDCGSCISAPVPIYGLAGVVDIAAFAHGGYALLANGTVHAWGDNFNGQLGGAGTGEYSTVPLQLPEPVGAVAVAGAWASGFAMTA